MFWERQPIFYMFYMLLDHCFTLAIDMTGTRRVKWSQLVTVAFLITKNAISNGQV